MQRETEQDLIVVSNRLPITLTASPEGYAFTPSAGGLATALSGLQDTNFLWVGWPGTVVPDEAQSEVERDLRRQHRCVPVFLNRDQVEQFYNRFSNGVLWPLFHYLPEYTDFELVGWNNYQEVNELFADTVARIAAPNSTIWIHDYHLMLLPRLLRERLPNAKIGFFLHIPFPSSEVYRLLPVRREILEGLVGADVIGFHTYDYARHFRSACMRVLGYEAKPDTIEAEGRRVRLLVAPIGIAPERFERLARDTRTQMRLERLRGQFRDRKVILGVDRLDYSKGLTHKLRAFERFLKRYGEWRNRCVFLQVAVPSRTGVERYRQLRREVEELVGHINGLYSSVEHTPVHFLFQSVSPTTLSALYQLGDVCWVSSIRDGMNLVSQEYVVSQLDGDGVLVLSEFAGAAQILDGALLVNPWNLDQMAEVLRLALEMPIDEREQRLARMREKIYANTSRDWARKFVQVINDHAEKARSEVDRRNLLDELPHVLNRCTAARQRYFLLDYDGTLRPFAPTPQDARPDSTIRELLQALASLPDTHVYVVSGRDYHTLERWLGDLDIGLCAEHGVLLREPGERRWERLVEVSNDWFAIVKPIMESYAQMTPGALVEEKTAALAWHFRRCDPDFGQWQANELAFHLTSVVSNLPVEVVHGHKVIEVRAQGANKGALAKYLQDQWTDEDFVFAIGDDTTDEDLFVSLPDYAITCRVGLGPSGAKYYLERQSDVPKVVWRMIEAVRGGVASTTEQRN